MRVIISFLFFLSQLMAPFSWAQETGPNGSVLRVPATGGRAKMGPLDLNSSNATTNQLAISKVKGSTSGACAYFGTGGTLSEETVGCKWDDTGKAMVIGSNSINASAAFQVDSTTKGMLVPRLTVTQRDAIVTPSAGLIVYNTTDSQLNFYDGANWLPVGSGSGSGGGGINLLTNFDFEYNVNGWTASGGALSYTTTAIFGKGSLSWDASAAAQTLSSALFTIPTGLKAQRCTAEVWYTGGSNQIVFEVVDNSSNVLSSTTLSTQTLDTQSDNPRLVFDCPSTGSIKWQLRATADAPVVKIDNVLLGRSLSTYLSNQPVCSIIASSATSDFGDYMLADGRTVSRTDYADYFSQCGTVYGNGNGTTTVHLPDFRGRFLRGVDGTANNDPDKASRSAMNTGGNTGNNPGSVQGSQFGSHRHRVYSGAVGSLVGGIYEGSRDSIAGYQANGTPWYGDYSADGMGPLIENTGGNETRPTNAGVNFFVKVRGTQSVSAIEANQLIDPIGTVLTVAGACPANTLEANGAQISRTDYPELFAKIGTAHGTGNGTTTFHLPDYRGRFLRGVDGGAGIDPSAGVRTALNPGGNTGDKVGTYQADEFATHTHAQTGSQSWNGVGGLDAGNVNGSSVSLSNTGPAGGWETRPKNVYVRYCVVARGQYNVNVSFAGYNKKIDTTATNERVERLAVTCTASSTINSSSFSGASISNISGGYCTVTIPAGLFSSVPTCTGTFAADQASNLVATNLEVQSTTSLRSYCKFDAGGTAALSNCSTYQMNIICMGPK